MPLPPRQKFFVSRTGRDKLVKWCEANGFDYWRRKMTGHKKPWCVLIEQHLAPLAAAELAGCSFSTEAENT